MIQLYSRHRKTENIEWIELTKSLEALYIYSTRYLSDEAQHWDHLGSNSCLGWWSCRWLHLEIISAECPTNLVQDKNMTGNIECNRPPQKLYNASDRSPTMHHVVKEICTCVYISVTKMCVVEYGICGLWDLCVWSIDRTPSPWTHVRPHADRLLCFLFHLYILVWLQTPHYHKRILKGLGCHAYAFSLCGKREVLLRMVAAYLIDKIS